MAVSTAKVFLYRNASIIRFPYLRVVRGSEHFSIIATYGSTRRISTLYLSIPLLLHRRSFGLYKRDSQSTSTSWHKMDADNDCSRHCFYLWHFYRSPTFGTKGCGLCGKHL